MNETQVRIVVFSTMMAVRVGLRSMLGGNEGFDVIAAGSDFESLFDDLLDADVLIVTGGLNFDDWNLGSDLNSQLGILWMTDDAQAAGILRKLSCRSWGIIPTEATEEELIAAVMSVNQGFIVAPGRMLESLWPEISPIAQADLIETLTPRETEVLQLLAQGLANKHIAQELEISAHTVKFHISSIYTKLDVGSRTEAVHLGLRLGIIIL